LHVFFVVVSGLDLLLSQLHDSFSQGLIISLKHNAACWYNLRVLNVTVKSFFLAFFELFLFVFFWLACFFINFYRSI
jgi:hypothetical protein